MHINAGLFTLALAGFTALAAANPHKHHINAHPHVPRALITEYVTKTVDQYGNEYPPPSPTARPVPPAKSPKEHGVEGAQAPEDVEAEVKVTPTSDKVFAFVTSTKAARAASAVPDNLDDGEAERKGTSGVDRDFPDGEIDCSHFPSEYGAVPLPWVTKDGWSGIQLDGGNSDHVGVCTDGALCSYACPIGYSKAQWPEDQPSSGESHGGLQCKNGKLYRTRKDFSKLCQAGKGTASVVNKLDKFVAICRTDYPGSENMVVPVSCSPGSTQELTVPDAANSYAWGGKPSSAQYYVNNAGVELEDGCVWGPPDGGRGNWSPVVIGAGFREGKTWLSIAQNNLNSKPLNYNIKIKADEGGKLSQECRYEDGKFSTGDSTGCTVAVESGSAKFVLY